MREDLITRLEQFKAAHPVDGAVGSRVVKPPVEFIGDDVLEQAVSALLQGENILLCGGKATGKNILADNLAWLFGRPVYNVSFHVNTDSSTLIGTDTFVDGEVRLRSGPVAQAALHGGFCILDEIDAALDDRNVERFASYLRNLSDKTQFVVITHRRGTMEASDVLYGVTMQEQGISKLLRLDLNQMEQYLGIVE